MKSKLNELKSIISRGEEFFLGCNGHEYDLSQWIRDSDKKKMISIVDELGNIYDYESIDDLFDNLIVDGLPLNQRIDSCCF